jgi:hypothetical protein
MATETKTRRESSTRRERSSGSGSGSRSGSGSSSRQTSGGGRDTKANADDRRFLERFGDQLSPSTQRARWIHSPDERPDRKGQTLATRSPDVVRAWAEERDGKPATATRGDDGRPRTLRITFTAADDSSGSRRRLEEISWDEWLGVFTERNLVFIYQQQRRDGRQSNFFRLDSPEREDG